MSVEERIAQIEKNDHWQLAFDGCHKIYFAQNEFEVEDARNTGYDMYPASNLRSLINKSCGLVFVHPWSLVSHELDIQQGDIYDEFGEEAV
jgi:hypothetical protein